MPQNKTMTQINMLEKVVAELDARTGDLRKVASETGMPPTGGFGVGIDRFLSIIANCETIRDVVFFPTMKPLPKE